MTNRQLARIHRALRIRAGLRQIDVAVRAGVGRWKVVDLEAAEIDSLSVGELRQSFEALGGRLDLVASFRGAALDRLLDEVHARLVGQVVAPLRGLGWHVEVEVSFNVYGDRGSIDVLAWKATERALLVIEIKSELGGLDGLLRPLDMKVRHAPTVARDRFGWDAATVSRLVVLPEDRTARRALERHSVVLDGALPARSRKVRRWIREPVGPLAGLWFLSDVGVADVKRNPSAIRRVRVPRPRSENGRPRSESGRPMLEKADLRLIDPHKVDGADI